MASSTTTERLSKAHDLAWRSVLDGLRTWIHRYFIVDCLLRLIFWLGLSFWLAWALDYLPVLMGANEMPVAARQLMLTIILGGALIVLYRYLWQPLRFRWRDANLANLIEKQHPELGERLLTAVEVSRADGVFGERMLTRVRAELSDVMDGVQLRRVFNLQPMLQHLGIAAALWCAIGLFGWFGRDLLATAFARIYLLRDISYPRRTYLELIGFSDGVMTVARGSNVTILVRADATRPTPPPRMCTIRYTLSDGTRGRVTMSKQGIVQEGFQEYVFDGKPFLGILSDVQLDVHGNDFTIHDHRIRVVDSPQVVAASLHILLPDYTGLLPRTVPYRPGLAIPIGSNVQVELRANKPLQELTLANDRIGPRAEGETRPPEAAQSLIPSADRPDSISFSLQDVRQDVSLLVSLHDIDGIRSGDPFRLSLSLLHDRLPDVDVRLRGIGTAVTPDAELPLQGEIRDDYGVQEVQIHLSTPTGISSTFPVATATLPAFSATLDLRSLREEAQPPLQLPLHSRISVGVQARDAYNLTDEPRIGYGDVFELEVVSPDELVSILEARELGLRQRFEQMIGEMQQMRDSLQRAVQPPSDVDREEQGAEPEDARVAEQFRDADLAPSGGLRLLRVQRAEQHAERARQEIIGVAVAFESIREELIHNRIDAIDRQNRLQNDIANPLREISDTLLRKLADTLRALAVDWQGGGAGQALGLESLKQTDQVVVAMEQVLNKMLELESYHELLDMIRSLIQEQEALERRTREEQQRRILELMEEQP